jgi:hypothetical protein
MTSPIPGQSANLDENVCSICFDLKLRNSPDSVLSINNPGRQGARALRQTELSTIANQMSQAYEVRIHYYELVESVQLGDCDYCHFLIQCLAAAKARVGGPDEVQVFKVIGRRGYPLYINWAEGNERHVVEVYANGGGSNYSSRTI